MSFACAGVCAISCPLACPPNCQNRGIDISTLLPNQISRGSPAAELRWGATCQDGLAVSLRSLRRISTFRFKSPLPASHSHLRRHSRGAPPAQPPRRSCLPQRRSYHGCRQHEGAHARMHTRTHARKFRQCTCPPARWSAPRTRTHACDCVRTREHVHLYAHDARAVSYRAEQRAYPGSAVRAGALASGKAAPPCPVWRRRGRGQGGGGSP